MPAPNLQEFLMLSDRVFMRIWGWENNVYASLSILDQAWTKNVINKNGRILRHQDQQFRQLGDRFFFAALI